MKGKFMMYLGQVLVIMEVSVLKELKIKDASINKKLCQTVLLFTMIIHRNSCVNARINSLYLVLLAYFLLAQVQFGKVTSAQDRLY
jgi:hypothetical protein